jgi:hypothetical protein
MFEIMTSIIDKIYFSIIRVYFILSLHTGAQKRIERK